MVFVCGGGVEEEVEAARRVGEGLTRGPCNGLPLSILIVKTVPLKTESDNKTYKKYYFL